MKYLLISTDGYSISTQVFKSAEDAYEKMEADYNGFKPDELLPDYKEHCFISDDEAALYDNGNNVYLWKIVRV